MWIQSGFEKNPPFERAHDIQDAFSAPTASLKCTMPQREDDSQSQHWLLSEEKSISVEICVNIFKEKNLSNASSQTAATAECVVGRHSCHMEISTTRQASPIPLAPPTTLHSSLANTQRKILDKFTITRQKKGDKTKPASVQGLSEAP